MRIELWNRLQPGDRCGNCHVQSVRPGLYHGSANFVTFAHNDKTHETDRFADYELHPDTLQSMNGRLLEELLAKETDRAAQNRPIQRLLAKMKDMSASAPKQPSGVTLTLELRLPKPGDKLPFTVCEYGSNLRLCYDDSTGWLMLFSGDERRHVNSNFLAEVFGIPASVEVHSTVVRLIEKQP